MVVRKKGGTGDVKSYLNVQSTDCTGNYNIKKAASARN